MHKRSYKLPGKYFLIECDIDFSEYCQHYYFNVVVKKMKSFRSVLARFGWKQITVAGVKGWCCPNCLADREDRKEDWKNNVALEREMNKKKKEENKLCLQ